MQPLFSYLSGLRWVYVVIEQSVHKKIITVNLLHHRSYGTAYKNCGLAECVTLIMKAIVCLVVHLLCCASAVLRPTYGIMGTQQCSREMFTIVEWMAATEMGGDAWIFQLKNDRRCEECNFLSYERITEWPYYCTRCVESFWGQMYEYSNCRACKVRSENCTTCQSDLLKLFREEDARRRRFAHPFLSRISIQWMLK